MTLARTHGPLSHLGWLLATISAAVALATGPGPGPAQDPTPAAASQEPERLGPPVPPGFPIALDADARPADPLVGAWSLRSRTIGGRLDPALSRGHVVFTSRLMFVYLAGPGPNPKIPLLRAGVRSWERSGQGIKTTALAGHFNDARGEVVVEPPGLVESRQIELKDDSLRIYQDQFNYLDFVRAE